MSLDEPCTAEEWRARLDELVAYAPIVMCEGHELHGQPAPQELLSEMAHGRLGLPPDLLHKLCPSVLRTLLGPNK